MAKQFITYYQRGSGTYVITAPRAWARENKNLFPDYSFSDKRNHPTSAVIINYLIENFGFIVGHKDSEISIIYNFNPSLDFSQE